MSWTVQNLLQAKRALKTCTEEQIRKFYSNLTFDALLGMLLNVVENEYFTKIIKRSTIKESNSINNNIMNDIKLKMNQHIIKENKTYEHKYSVSNHVYDLPEDVITKSFQYLDFESKYNISITSFRFYDLLHNRKSNYNLPTSDLVELPTIYSKSIQDGNQLFINNFNVHFQTLVLKNSHQTLKNLQVVNNTNII